MTIRGCSARCSRSRWRSPRRCSASPSCSPRRPPSAPTPSTTASRRSRSPTRCARAPTTSRAWSASTSTTGEERYRRYYDEILAIRRGDAPRPVDYDSSFWDRVLADGETGERLGPPRSAAALMREADFADAEFTALNEASRPPTRSHAPSARSCSPAITTAWSTTPTTARRARSWPRSSASRARRRAHGPPQRRAHEPHRPAARAADADAGPARRRRRGAVRARRAADRAAARAPDRGHAPDHPAATGASARPSDGVVELKQLAADFNEMTDAVERDLAARRAAEHRLQTIADRVPGAVFQFSVDDDGALSARFFSRGGAHLDFRSFAREVIPDDRGAWLDGMLDAARRGGAWHHEYRVHADGGGIAWMEAHALGQRRRASSTATSPTSPSARRSRQELRRRARRPRAPTAPSRASWPRSATSCARRSSPSPARSTCSRPRRSPPSSAT